ncbi:MAG: ATP-binding protein [Oscillospiraceae bacterium]|nr:ATP-binding protein [Oscillospiraceae bacterium]
MEKMVGLVRRCVDDYHMIEPGETVAVGVSGGKDSLALLTLLHALSAYHPAHFRVEAFTADMGLPGMDYAPVAAYCEKLGVPYHLLKTEIGPILFEYRKERNPCALCAKMRRGALHTAMTEAGIHKIALGHHYDDAVETFLLSLFYEGRISCFQPVTELTRTGVTQIRPMLYIGEKGIASLARRLELPVVHNACPADKHTKRQEVKELVAQLAATYPDLKSKIFGAMQRLPLPEWAPEGSMRRPRPEEL